jgi:hypothetical protein
LTGVSRLTTCYLKTRQTRRLTSISTMTGGSFAPAHSTMVDWPK